MGRHKQPYSIYKRNTGYYYYRTYDKWGRRTVPKTTGKTNRDAAEAYCEMLLRQGRLVGTPTMTFAVYAEPWWIWETCPYVRAKAMRDEQGDGLSPDYVIKNRNILKKWILPHFGRLRLDQITPDLIDEWMMNLVTPTGDRKEVSYKYANNIFNVLSVMLNVAVKQRLIAYNPCSSAYRLKAKTKVRELFTGAELAELIKPETWGGVTQGYLANMLSASTGMRWGEIRALMREDYHHTYIHVRWSLTNKGVRVRVKNKEERLAPVPSKMQALLDKHGCAPYLLSKQEGARPIPLSEGNDTLKAALAVIKVNDPASRGLTFHAWRHFFNTMMRSGGVPDAKVRAVTGHKTSAMMDHYTSFRSEDYADIIQVQEHLF